MSEWIKWVGSKEQIDEISASKKPLVTQESD